MAMQLLLCWSLYGDLRGSSEFAAPMDHHKYLFMSDQSIGSFHIAPFCWRIATPFLVHCLPGDDHFSSFLIINSIFLVATAVIIGLVVYDQTTSSAWAWVGVLVYSSLGWITRGFMFYGASVDPLAILLGLVVAVALRRKSFSMALGAALVGAFAKDSIMISVVVAMLLFGQHLKMRQVLILSGVPFIVLIGLRLIIPALNTDASYINALSSSVTLVQNGTSEYGVQYLLYTFVPQRIASFTLADLNALFFDSYGLALAGLTVVILISNLRRGLLLVGALVLTWGQVLFAVNIQRPVLLVAPVYIIFALGEVGALQPKFKVHLQCFGAILSVLLALVTVITSRLSPSIFTQSGAVVVSIAMFIFLHSTWGHTWFRNRT